MPENYVTASIGGRSLSREATTVGHTDEPVRFYRASDPPIFAGFQARWVEGEDPQSGADFEVCAGAGFGSRYMTLSVNVPGHDTVYEYVDITEVLEKRVRAIAEEVISGGGS